MTSGAAQKIAAAHIGEQTDVGFGHCHHGAFGHQAQACTLADAHAATHHDPVHESDVGFVIRVDEVIEGVFLGEEIVQRRIAGQRRLVKKADVTTGAKRTKWPFFAHAAHDHRQHNGVVLPAQQRIRDCTHHVQ